MFEIFLIMTWHVRGDGVNFTDNMMTSGMQGSKTVQQGMTSLMDGTKERPLKEILYNYMFSQKLILLESYIWLIPSFGVTYLFSKQSLSQMVFLVVWSWYPFFRSHESQVAHISARMILWSYLFQYLIPPSHISDFVVTSLFYTSLFGCIFHILESHIF